MERDRIEDFGSFENKDNVLHISATKRYNLDKFKVLL